MKSGYQLLTLVENPTKPNDGSDYGLEGKSKDHGAKASFTGLGT